MDLSLTSRADGARPVASRYASAMARVGLTPLAPRPAAGDNAPAQPFARVPSDVALALAHLPRALACWIAVESAVGRHGGAGDVPQRMLIRQLGWCPSTWWRARKLLILLGMLEVAPPSAGPVHGPGARRRLVLVHFIPRRVRREAQRSAAKASRRPVPANTAPPVSAPTVGDDNAERGPPPDVGPVEGSPAPAGFLEARRRALHRRL
jgi:hypothetical protein